VHTRTAVPATMLVVLAILISAMPASADDSGIPTIVPAKLTSAERAANEAKVALARKETRKPSGTAVHASGSTGSAYANIYMEPQATYALNWCGAGTATVLIAGWQIKTQGYDTIGSYSRYSAPGWGSSTGWYYGGTAFLQHLAYDRDVVQDRATGLGITEPSRDYTQDYSDETHDKNAVNAEIGSSFYVVWQNMGTLSNFDTALYYDIGAIMVPFSAVVRPAPSGQVALSGWTGAPAGMYHWVSLGAYDMNNDQITYGDSASTRQAYGGNPWYWHYWTRSTFFGTYMTPYLSGTVVW